ncbi:MAG: Gfo/Idh/MocA family oxidoreductase, partial [Candidatus Brocadiia bacterium]|nr:Gfo/Idh/MocA family oxidoreductase [Candidatus Brocadiia bacterium]
MAGKGIGVGLIGCGTMGSRLTRAIEELDVGRVVAIWDTAKGPMDSFVDNLRPRGEKIADEFRGRACSSLDDMLADAEVEAIVVATPDFCHEEPVVAAAGAGKHVFVEKPLTLTVAEARQAIAAASKAGIVLMVGHHRRRQGATRRLREMLDKGELGMLHHLEANLSSPIGLKPR